MRVGVCVLVGSVFPIDFFVRWIWFILPGVVSMSEGKGIEKDYNVQQRANDLVLHSVTH